MFRVCVDVGGTFTDCVACDSEGKLSEFKSPSTPDDFSKGVMDALSEAANAYKLTMRSLLEDTEVILHGSTVATNALITRKLAKTALITSKGFRDTIETRCSLKAETKSIYDFFIPPYEPIVPRYLRFGVDEAIRNTGEIIRQVDETELNHIINKIKDKDVEAIAICFINAYANDANEQKAAEICKRELPGIYIVTSCEILPQLGEYARTSTCVISASLGPVSSRYLSTLEGRLTEAGFTGQLLVIQSNQLAQSSAAIVRKPVYLINSGPSTAPAGGSHLGNLLDEKNLITGDMGGTSFDMSVIKEGQVGMTLGRWLEDDWVGIEMVDVDCIGAGGGSLAWVNALGLLCIGPASAGAVPGPACYGRGGKEPTVTDAAVILGYIPVDFFLGGKIQLDKDLALSAVKSVADKLNLTVEQTAHMIFSIANSNMVNGIMQISTKKGYDLRDFSLLALGGAGSLHAAFLAESMDISRVIIPMFAASFCAWSMFTLDIGRGYSRSYISHTDSADSDTMNQLFNEMTAEAINEFAPLNIPEESIKVIRSAEMRYHEQFYNIEIPMPAKDVRSKDIDRIVESFHNKHSELYNFSMNFTPVEFRNLRILVTTTQPKIKAKEIESGTEDAAAALKRSRMCFLENDYIETPIYDGDRLKSGNIIPGPAIIEEVTTTVVIPGLFRCEVDKYGNYILRRK